MMEIKMITKVNELEYEVAVQTSDGLEIMVVLADTLVELHLLKPQPLTMQQYQILKQNYALAYRQAIQYLSYRQRSCGELEQYLLEKGHERQQVMQVISRLQEQRYLDDTLFAQSYVRTAYLDNKQGPNKVKQTLQQKFRIGPEAIEEALTYYSEDIQRKNIAQLIAKLIRTNKKYVNRALEQQIMQKLRQYGYPIQLAQLVWQEEQEIQINETEEAQVFIQQAEKVYRRLQRESDQYKKRQKFCQKMYQLGFAVAESQEWFEKQENEDDETN